MLLLVPEYISFSENCFVLGVDKISSVLFGHVFFRYNPARNKNIWMA